MKAKTILQKRIVALSKNLPPTTIHQERWAIDNCFVKLGYATKHRVLCLECGNKFPTTMRVRSRATCPHCLAKLHIEQSAKRSNRQDAYFALAFIVEEFQVVRHYKLKCLYELGQFPDIDCFPILEQWILPNGKYEFIGKLHNTSGWCDSWHGSWEIRDKRQLYKYNVHPDRYLPGSKFKPEYKKYGINSLLRGLGLIDAIKIVTRESMGETLLKARQYELLGSMAHMSYKVRDFWPSIKICIRNKYKPSDADIWFDYLDLLRYFGRDLRSPKYVCPKNLKAEHDRLVRKKEDKERREEIERRRQNIAKAEVEYSKRIKPYLGLQFTSGKITVKVLESVQEFDNEGRALKHCVFVNDYYNKKDSLVLSARINDQPIETIEVSLKSLKIVQSRGLQNNPSVYNKRIVALVQKNLPKIKAIHQQKTA